jgi:hypothetical protein
MLPKDRDAWNIHWAERLFNAPRRLRKDDWLLSMCDLYTYPQGKSLVVPWVHLDHLFNTVQPPRYSISYTERQTVFARMMPLIKKNAETMTPSMHSTIHPQNRPQNRV